MTQATNAEPELAKAQRVWESYVMEEAIPADVRGEAYDRIVRQLRHALVTGYLAGCGMDLAIAMEAAKPARP